MKHRCDRDGRVTYCYRQDSSPAFDARVFDQEHFKASGHLKGIAEGGRGNTFFVEHDGAALVLRHYRRGGAVRSISDASYIYLGLERTRAYGEFQCLCKLEELNLPAARAYACRIERRGVVYSASLVTYQIDGATLATRLVDGKVSADDWRRIGQCVARFHHAGICHADLNAHNILIDDNGTVSLIDFDRARIFKPVTPASPLPWHQANIERLWRSVCKCSASKERHFDGFKELRIAWAESWISV